MTATTKTATVANFSDEQVAAINAAAVAHGTLNLAIATELATAMDKKPRSVIAKINRMGLPYARKVAVSKTGEPVTKKSDLVERIAAIVSGNLDGLDKAPKAALVAIASFVEEQDERVAA